ncbi:MAG: DUF4301 family protein [Smithellaceae bacterium]
MTKDAAFTAKDRQTFQALGLTKRDVAHQLALYTQGPRFLDLQRPCTVGDGILSIGATRKKKLIERYEDEAGKFRILKFVPASGAASRMFARWYAAAGQGCFGKPMLDREFWRGLKKMPFFSEIVQSEEARAFLAKKDIEGMLHYILLEDGLQYGWLPKALIPFHACGDATPARAIEEHLTEAAWLVKNKRGQCRLHFTVSAEHVGAIKKRLKQSVPRYENKHGVRFKIDLSVQSPSSNRLAVDERKQPFRDPGGSLVFRPGGHGALLANLNTLEADLIFVKNIDNVVPETRLPKILPYKKMLGGLALEIREAVFSALDDLDTGRVSPADIARLTDFCRQTFFMDFGSDFDKATLAEKKKTLFLLLHRPLRICGMVRNEGEPGGGPFWVAGKDKTQTVQIVESAHVDSSNPRQAAVWSSASYFNPVDMVCCIRDFRDRLFDLQKYVDPDAYLISAKTEKGRTLLAQELPGLWNGGMARWNTIFVELPINVFNPVKTVDDLLRPQHQSSGKKKKIKA